MDLKTAESEPMLSPLPQQRRSTRFPDLWRNPWRVFFTIWLLLSNFSAICLYLSSRAQDLDSSCAKYTSEGWSPALSAIPITYSTITFDGSFLPENIYRQPPSQEVDDAWSSLGINYGVVIIPYSRSEVAEISPDHFKIDQEDGIGPGYAANVEVLHQLHCLNLLRKALYFNADYYLDLRQGEFADKPSTSRTHITHCLDILRQQLMCVGDVGLVPYISQEGANGNKTAVPDFSRKHKCRNFSDIQQWVAENSYAV